MPRGIPGSGPKGKKRKLAMAATQTPKGTAISGTSPQAAFKLLTERGRVIAAMQHELTQDVMSFLFGIN